MNLVFFIVLLYDQHFLYTLSDKLNLDAADEISKLSRFLF